MEDELFGLLEKLSNAHGISGYEDEIREVIKAELEDFVDEIKIDNLGNLIAIKNGSEQKLMLAAHMDEIGFMVKYIDDRGFIRVTPIGGWFAQTVLNQRVILHGSKGKVYGVFGCKPPHIMQEDERKKVIKIKDMFVDVGASNKDEVLEMGINIGTPITVDRELVRLGQKVTGKAFDDRAGIAAMIAALKETKSDATIYAVGTVQEEVGLKGARTSAFAIEPSAAIALDVCVATDFPGAESAHMDIKLGKGPAITVADAAGRGLIASKKVLDWLTESAQKSEIPYQLEVAEGGTTDATAIHLTKAGIPTGVVSIPARYIHTPVEVIDIRDLKNTALLVARALERADRYFK
ncbi:M42 family metallopeptidase [Archaeoglobus veneficus]|uniref:Cellulase n=1 Tax=Archaeoglobus veneficus (strain DSM 11195 / SNP6) TaxID=693661 RepID=F2KSG4_ARCVS|nr:M42 family metallopeptidase [Archaeoglobus veneficus]AEA46933.1 Cellulase [Archaeoglobus veneficus SNP6]